MCGIIGINWPDESKIKILNNLMKHRGPDDAGIYIDENISLAQRRLSILDLTPAGHQPMFYHPQEGACSEFHKSANIPKAKVGIVFNGEIYNFQTLKVQLQEKGYFFNTRCDTELVLAAYLEWGHKCVKKFNGMWAFGIYDKSKNRFFLSRDRYGIKPLYYYENSGIFMFSSELKPFIRSHFHFDIDSQALNFFHYFSITPRNRSMLKGVKKLLPAHNLIYDLTENKIVNYKPYWHIEFNPVKRTEDQHRELIFNALDKAVKRRLLADVPVGAFLSGGLDSSIIVSFMRKYVNDLKTFSIRFDYHKFNESKWAQLVAKHFNTIHHEIEFSHRDVKELIDTLPYYYDEPFADASMIPTFLVSKVAAKHVTVILSGTGGDELFAGYSRYHEYIFLKKLCKYPRLAKKFITTMARFYSHDIAGKLENLLFSNDSEEMYIKLFSHLFRHPDDQFPDKDIIQEVKKFMTGNHRLTQLLNFDQHVYLPDDLLIKEDRATMAHSIEGRVPFLDHEVAEVANTIPPGLKMYGHEKKYILKKAFEGILPDRVTHREKKGFGVPLEYYLRKELKNFAEEIIFDYNGFDFYDREELLQLWKQHQQKKYNYAPLFWNIIMLNKWHYQWMKK